MTLVILNVFHADDIIPSLKAAKQHPMICGKPLIIKISKNNLISKKFAQYYKIYPYLYDIMTYDDTINSKPFGKNEYDFKRCEFICQATELNCKNS